MWARITVLLSSEKHIWGGNTLNAHASVKEGHLLILLELNKKFELTVMF